MRTPPDMSHWEGRTDVEEGALARRWHQQVKAWQNQASPGIALLGFACDAGVVRNQGRPGAKEGPAAIRRALANLAWHHPRNIYDAGDVSCPGDELEAVQIELSEHVAMLLFAGHFPLVLGGGHEMAYGNFLGLYLHAQTQSKRPVIGIINFDSHFDLRAGQRGTSGTPFRQIAERCNAKGTPFRYLVFGIAELANTEALFRNAREFDVVWESDEGCAPEHKKRLLEKLLSFADKVDWLYLTICLDVLPAAVAPGVSAPAVRGVDLAVIDVLIDAAKATGKLMLADIAELNPALDRDNQTAKVAARLAWRLAR